MATTDQELKNLNKTVTEAVNILKLYVGNSGQLKAKNESEKKIIEGWLKITDMQEEREKHQRAFTERERDAHGRFIKKREGSWGKFLDMAENTFKVLDKVTLGITSKIKNMVTSVLSHVGTFFTELKSQFLSLFGEESEWFGIMKSIKDSITGIVGTLIGWIWKKTPGWAKKMNKYLGDMYNLQVKQMKMGFLDAGGDTKKKGISATGILGALVFAIGSAIGAFMHRYFVLITKLPLFSKVASFFTKLESIPFLGKLLKSIKFGFRILGWPLTLLLSVIDFINGFKETEGTLWEKVKGGLWAALEGFIDLPVRFIGWITEKVAGWFGAELTNVADSIMDTIKKGFDFLIDFSPLKYVFEFIETFFSTEGTFVQKFKAGASKVITGITDVFKNLWNNLVDWMTNKIPSWLPKSGSIIKSLKGMKFGEETTPINPTERKSTILKSGQSVEVEKIKKQNEKDKSLLDMMRNLWDATKEGAVNTGRAINNIATVQNNNSAGAGGDFKQIPDETDNVLMGINNHNGAME